MRPWAEHGSCSTRVFFSFNSAVHVLPVVYFFIFLFFFVLVLSVTRPKLPLGQVLNHTTCDVYSPKAVQNLYMDNVMDIVFFIVGTEICFLLVLLKHWIRREIISRLKKVLRQPWNALTLQLSLSLHDE